jgi:hypothetical protein
MRTEVIKPIKETVVSYTSHFAFNLTANIDIIFQIIVVIQNSILSRWDNRSEAQLSGDKHYIPMGLSLLGQNVYRNRKYPQKKKSI